MAHGAGDTEQVADLAEAELFVVWAARAWVTALKDRRPICPTVRLGFRLAGADNGLDAVDRLFGVMARWPRRDLDFRCMTCPGLGGDETLLLQCVAGLQYGDARATGTVLEDWLPWPQIPVARLHAYDFAATLRTANLLIPTRRLRHTPPAAGLLQAPGGCSVH